MTALKNSGIIKDRALGTPSKQAYHYRAETGPRQGQVPGSQRFSLFKRGIFCISKMRNIEYL